MEELVNLVGNVGFPIVAFIMMYVLIDKRLKEVDKQLKKVGDELIRLVDKISGDKT